MAAQRNEALVIRADAGPEIGLGHIMRCLGLAEAWESRCGPVVFVTRVPSEPVRRRVEQEGFGLVALPDELSASEDVRWTSKVLAEHPGAWAAVDGYGFDGEYHRMLRASGHPVLVVDDMAHLPRYEVEALLNQNAHAQLLTYRTLPRTRRLLGLPYVLLRREFRERRREARGSPQVARKLLVSFGGADPQNTTRRVLDALTELTGGDLEATVVVGPANPRREELEGLVRSRDRGLTVATGVDDMAKLMETADLAIVGGGSSVWELAFLGVPALVLPNGRQEEFLARGLSHVGLGRVLGPESLSRPARLRDEVYRAVHDAAWREAQSTRGRQLVDGDGADRVVTALVGSGEVVHA